MFEQEKIEHVIEIFADFIDSTSDIDVALTRKNGYVLLIDSECSDSIWTGREMCETLLHEIEISFRVEKELAPGKIPAELRPEMHQWMQEYLKHLPEYQDLLEEYQ